MNRTEINKIVEAKIGSIILTLTPLHGGSISSAFKITVKSGEEFFIKISPQFSDMFIKEAHGLEDLKKANAVRVPNVILADEQILVLEFLPVSSFSNRKKFFEDFGRRFAQMHRYSGSSFGFYEDNYIGSTLQRNTVRSQSWKEFYFSQRLEFQLKLAEKNGYSDTGLLSLFQRLEQQIDDLIPNDGEPPALLHGDLWGGNFLCLEDDIPAIIDPAIYFGHREADLAMTLLFGGFDSTFYKAYNEEYPLHNGWEKRMEIYKLYHLFNHLNIFGAGYYGQVVETMRALIK
jgi:protein-ribulosamine 3-kinase